MIFNVCIAMYIDSIIDLYVTEVVALLWVYVIIVY